MHTQKRLTTIVLVLVCAICLAGPALAGEVGFSGNRSNSFNNNKQIKVFDGQFDGKQAYSVHFSFNGTKGLTYDTTGANDSEPGISGVYSSRIQRHNTCEDTAGVPDYCTNFHKH